MVVLVVTALAQMGQEASPFSPLPGGCSSPASAAAECWLAECISIMGKYEGRRGEESVEQKKNNLQSCVTLLIVTSKSCTQVMWSEVKLDIASYHPCEAELCTGRDIDVALQQLERFVTAALVWPDEGEIIIRKPPHRVGVSSRNSLEIFQNTYVTSSERPVASSIGAFLEHEITEDTVHSNVICKKCYKLLNEADEIEVRLADIKLEVQENYKRTLVLQMEGDKSATEGGEEHEKLPLSSEDGNVRPPRRRGRPRKHESHNSEEEYEQKENAIMVAAEMVEQVGSDDEINIEMLAAEAAGEDLEAEGELHVKIKLEPGEIGHMKDYMGRRRNMMKRKSRLSMHQDDIPDQVIMREGNEFACLLCTGSEKVIGDMKGISTHMKTTHNTRIYICDMCGQDFRKRNELSMHLDEHVAAEEGDFQCEVCNRIFTNLRLFRVHKRMHYPQAKLWTCETCGKRYSSRNLLDEHINVHLGVRPYKCRSCGKDFASKYTYKAHTKTHEERPRPFSCGDCGKTFLSAQNLQQHERTHNGLRNYVCDQCGKAFGTARNLEVHSVVHSGYKPFICRTCGKAFARKAEIRDHERTHTGEKPYQCEFCGATFSQRSNLQSHKRAMFATHLERYFWINTDKRYKCLDCGKGFKRRRLLDYHVKAAHTGERPYKCSICEATFVYPEHFKKHRRIHTGEKPFLCEVCGKAFNSRDNRNAHRFVHSDKKPYECLVCGAGFMRKPLLYNHMQSQGHLNDTIVVNQPRLTNEEDLVNIAVEAGDMEMTIVDATDQTDQDAKLYIHELKDHVIIQEGDEHMYAEKTVVVGGDDGEDEVHQLDQDNVQHLIIDGSVHFADASELANLHGEVAEITTTAGGQYTKRIVVPAVPAVQHNMEEGSYEDQENQEGESIMTLTPSQSIETPDGHVRLVHIRIPSGQARIDWSIGRITQTSVRTSTKIAPVLSLQQVWYYGSQYQEAEPVYFFLIHTTLDDDVLASTLDFKYELVSCDTGLKPVFVIHDSSVVLRSFIRKKSSPYRRIRDGVVNPFVDVGRQLITNILEVVSVCCVFQGADPSEGRAPSECLDSFLDGPF
uniref:C2H2-type domain-containing protein n=1 Tax=Timema genevievae TaxID=629358 RepID=A0A7R9JSP9_TIMGE|nr:unnamed protein product [Timema genevievae]